LESAGYHVLISSRAEEFTRPRIDDHEQLPKVPRNEHSYDYNRLWSPQRPTVVYVNSVAFGLAVIENVRVGCPSICKWKVRPRI
jgi:hypothetical protein